MSKKEYGKFEVEGDLDIKKAKAKITMYIDGDLLEKIRDEAVSQNTKYQTLINSMLRQSFLKEKGSQDRLIDLEKRVERLEGSDVAKTGS